MRKRISDIVPTQLPARLRRAVLGYITYAALESVFLWYTPLHDSSDISKDAKRQGCTEKLAEIREKMLDMLKMISN